MRSRTRPSENTNKERAWGDEASDSSGSEDSISSSDSGQIHHGMFSTLLSYENATKFQLQVCLWTLCHYGLVKSVSAARKLPQLLAKLMHFMIPAYCALQIIQVSVLCALMCGYSRSHTFNIGKSMELQHHHHP